MKLLNYSLVLVLCIGCKDDLQTCEDPDITNKDLLCAQNTDNQVIDVYAFPDRSPRYFNGTSTEYGDLITEERGFLCVAPEVFDADLVYLDGPFIDQEVMDLSDAGNDAPGSESFVCVRYLE